MTSIQFQVNQAQVTIAINGNGSTSAICTSYLQVAIDTWICNNNAESQNFNCLISTPIILVGVCFMQFLVFADCCMGKGGICMLLTCSYWRTKKQQYISYLCHGRVNEVLCTKLQMQFFFKVTPKTLS